MTEPADNTRAGFVALLGAPNAGKSTLLNALVGGKVSIVSPKAQTTRTRVLGIAMRDLPDGTRAQIAFVDTPGIHGRRQRRLERAMVRAAWQGAADADLVAVLVDAARGFGDEARAVVAGLRDIGKPCVLVFNKIDLIRRDKLLALSAAANAAYAFERTFMVSAKTGNGLDDFADWLATALPAGPLLYPEDQLTDMPLRLLAAEIVREQVFLQLHDELPYEAAVETEAWTERPDGSARVDCAVFVMRESQRPIVLGEGGARIKMIGSRARKQLIDIVDRPVHLFLTVKVKERWAEDRIRYGEWGLDYDV
ncbi:GTPase Era [Vineibacter terrae]|uniref:GTPase Era n=1 Tax=Vineibacter terrae TaxID=2586908 RepID=A0A5C8P939_9HYPH|nr:GTPase Era [Vineibacter terrae]TXL70026.1 GTPase Era [Vineibacter terrae]